MCAVRQRRRSRWRGSRRTASAAPIFTPRSARTDLARRSGVEADSRAGVFRTAEYLLFRYRQRETKSVGGHSERAGFRDLFK